MHGEPGAREFRSGLLANPSLLESDLEMFGHFGIGPELLADAGVCRITDAEARKVYGMGFNGDLGGVLYPYFHPVTENRVTARLRRDNPEVGSDRKPENKYMCAHGDNRHLYFPPGAGALLSDVTVPVVFVESEKSALAITALAARNGRRLLTIATGGCWGWRGKTGIESGPNGERDEARGPLPDFGLIAWEGRKVLIAFDSNVTSNPKVQQARRALAETLRGWGAGVFLVGLPEAEGVNGPDDFIALAGDQAMLALLDAPLPFGDKSRTRDAGDANESEPESAALPAFPEAAWRGIFKQYREVMRTCSEASDVYNFLTLWVVAGNALGRRAWFDYGMRLHANVYGICFGPTGDFKTSACRRGSEITRDSGLRVVSGIGSAEGLLDGLSEEPTLFFLEEFTTLLRQGKWDGSTLLSTLTEVFDCPEKVEREYRKKPISLHRPVCSILAGTTEAWFWRDVRESDFEGGFGNRFIYLTGPPNKPVSRPIIPDLGFVIDAIPKLKAVPEQKVHLEGKAEEIWDRFYLVWRTTEQSLSPLERAATKRVPSYVLKLGMTYAAMEGTLPQITAGQLTAALMVGNYAAKCARHLIGARFSGADPQRELEGKITAILNQTPGRVVSKRNLHRALARHFRNAEQFNRVVWSMSCSGLLYLRTRERGRVDVSAEPLD